MKILLVLDSVFFSTEQNASLHSNMIEIDWDLPFIPNMEDDFDFDNIVEEEKWPYFYEGLSWRVYSVSYTKKNNVLTPILFLAGE